MYLVPHTLRLLAGSLLLIGMAHGQAITSSVTQLSFSFATPGAASQTRQVPVSVTGGQGRLLTASVSAAGAAWLSVSPSTVANPDGMISFTVTANPASLAAGNYSSSIDISMSSALPVMIPVTVTVGPGQATGVSLTPSSVTLSAAVGGNAVTQLVSVTAPTGTPATAFTAIASSQGNWLAVSPAAGSTPAELQVTATPGALTAGSYPGTVTVTPTGGQALTLNITFNVGQSQSGLTASPSTLTFSVAPNSGPSAVQTIAVSVAGAQLSSVSAVPSTTSGGNWLTVTPLSGNSPLSLSVSVNPQGLPAASYSGSIALSVVGSTAAPVLVPVSLTVLSSQSSALQASPASLTFNVSPTGPSAQSQTVNLTTTAGAAALQVSASVLGPAWITANPSSLTTPGTLTISINTAGLPEGIYQATINLTSPAAAQVSIPVTINVGGNASNAADLFPSSLAFDVQTGRTLPGGQLISIGGTAGTYSASATTAAGGAWLQVASSTGSIPGVTVARLADSVVTSLAPGTYNGSITITPSGGAPSRTVSVRLTVATAPALTSTASLLSFTSGLNSVAPSPVSFTVDNSSGTPAPIQVTSSTQSGSGWLTATSSTNATPAQITLTVNPGGLAAGTYEGAVTVSSSLAGVANLVVPVRLRVLSGNLISASPSQLTFASSSGSAPSPQTISLSATGTGTAQFTATAAVVSPAGGSWLSAQPTSGNLPGSITISVNPAGLAGGDYAGTVTITSAGLANSPLVIPVVFRMAGSAAPGINPTPGTLSFSQAPGASSPLTQALQLSAPAATAFTTTVTTASGGTWLSVTPTSGQTPATLSVTVANASALAVGTYTGSIAIASSLGTSTIPVTLTVGSPGATSPLTAAPASLTFTGPSGGANPAAQSVQVSTSAINPAQPFTATVNTQSGGNWLSITPAAGTTPASVQVSINLAGLAAGTYNGSVILTPQGAQALTIPVALTVSGGGSGTTPAVRTVVHAATQQSAGAISPGLVVFIRGTGLGPVNQSTTQLDSQGRVSTSLANVRVLFDSLPAPLLAVQQDAISAVVPFAVASRNSVQMVVEYNGVASAPVTLSVADAAPGILSIAGTGSGQGAILNQDLTINSATNPAARGSIAVLYLTGDGAVTPSGVDGEVTSASNPRRPVRNVQLRVGGVSVLPANILFHGPAPSMVLGVTQVNFVVPEGIAAGNAVPVEVISGTFVSPSTVTMAVQ